MTESTPLDDTSDSNAKDWIAPSEAKSQKSGNKIINLEDGEESTMSLRDMQETLQKLVEETQQDGQKSSQSSLKANLSSKDDQLSSIIKKSNNNNMLPQIKIAPKSTSDNSLMAKSDKTSVEQQSKSSSRRSNESIEAYINGSSTSSAKQDTGAF